METILSGTSTKTVQGHFFFLQSYGRKSKDLPLLTFFQDKYSLKVKMRKSCPAPKQAWNWGNNIQSVLCDPFQTKILPSFHWGFQSQPQILNYSFSAPLKHNQTDLSSSLCPTKYSGNPFWINLFPNPSLQCWNNSRDQKEHQSSFYYSLWPRTWTYGTTTKRSQPWHKISRASTPKQIYLSNTVNHGTRKSKEATNCFWGVPSTACSQTM